MNLAIKWISISILFEPELLIMRTKNHQTERREPANFCYMNLSIVIWIIPWQVHVNFYYKYTRTCTKTANVSKIDMGATRDLRENQRGGRTCAELRYEKTWEHLFLVPAHLLSLAWLAYASPTGSSWLGFYSVLRLSVLASWQYRAYKPVTHHESGTRDSCIIVNTRKLTSRLEIVRKDVCKNEQI